MEYSELVNEACDLHLVFAKKVYMMIEHFQNRSEGRILLWLWQQEKPCAVDIIDHFGLSAGRVSNILKDLEERGYLFREKSTHDRRVAYIALTEKGQQEAQSIWKGLHEVYQSFFETIGQEDAQAFLSFERKVMELPLDSTTNLDSKMK